MIRPVRPDGSIETGGVFVPITRRRVVDRIASAAMQRVVLIVAPAGYGKSVALRQYLQAAEGQFVRYDVLPDNVGLLGFLRGLADAIVEIAPDARTTLAGAYEKNASSSSPGNDLALWMHSHLKSYRGIIAIDDLHVAQDDREVTRFLSSLIDRTKGRVQWVIASRSTLGLPIGTWLAYGDSDLAIDEHDLKFSVEEARDAARAFRLAVRDEELYELLNLTDGWATAMSFALRSSTRSVDLRNISSMTREMIYRYLAEQVYETLNDEERQFIETAAILPYIDLPVLVTLGFDEANATLNELRQRVAFIHEVEPGRFRLHDLFREFALHQLNLRGNAAVLERYTKIAEILLENDDPVGALRLYVTANNWDAVQRQLETRGLSLVSHGYADDVEQCLSALPTAQQQGAVLTLLRGVIAVARGRYAQGESQLRSSLDKIEDRSLRCDAALRLALMQANRGEDASTILRDVLSDKAVDEGRKLEARAILAGYYAATGNKSASRSEITNVESVIPGLTDQERIARVAQRLGFAYARLDEHDLSTLRSKQAAEIASARGLWSLAARAYVQLSINALITENQPSLALWNAQQAASAASRAGDYYDLQTSLLMMLSIETRRANIDRAAQIERQLGELGSTDSSRAHYIASSQAHRHAYQGKFRDAHRLFGSVLGRQAHASDRALIHSLFALTLALDGQVQPSAKAAADAQALLDSSDTSTGEGALVFESARLFIVAAEIVNGRLTVASRLLRKRPLSGHDIADCMQGIVEDLVREARSPSYEAEEIDQRTEMLRDFGFGGYARYFALARELVHARHHQESDVSVSLTPSELRILRALAGGMSPKDIATEMGRSVYTVQTHIQNLTEKLGCHGRAEAIATARRRGLLVTGSNAST